MQVNVQIITPAERAPTTFRTFSRESNVEKFQSFFIVVNDTIELGNKRNSQKKPENGT